MRHVRKYVNEIVRASSDVDVGRLSSGHLPAALFAPIRQCRTTNILFFFIWLNVDVYSLDGATVAVVSATFHVVAVDVVVVVFSVHCQTEVNADSRNFEMIYSHSISTITR